MVLESTKEILVLDGVPEVPLDGVLRACSPLEAAALTASRRPAALVVSTGVAWHRSFVASLPLALRPAVLGVGPQPGFAVDEWVPRVPEPEELRARLRLARQRAKERQRSGRRAFTDALTGLPNRRALIQALVREAARARRRGPAPGLVLLDLDGLKAVNEFEGHDAGDRLLRRVGAVLASEVRCGEVCGRIGGDEFAVLVSGDGDGAQRVARRLTIALRDAGVSATAASGVLRSQEALRALYRRVDAQLRQAKRRRRVVRLVTDVPGPVNDAPVHRAPVAHRALAGGPHGRRAHIRKEERRERPEMGMQ